MSSKKLSLAIHQVEGYKMRHEGPLEVNSKTGNEPTQGDVFNNGVKA